MKADDPQHMGSGNGNGNGNGNENEMKRSIYVSELSLTVSEMTEADTPVQTTQQKNDVVTLLQQYETTAFDSIEATVDRTAFPPLPTNPIYEPMDVALNPTEAYGESGDHPKPLGALDELWSMDVPPESESFRVRAHEYYASRDEPSSTDNPITQEIQSLQDKVRSIYTNSDE